MKMKIKELIEQLQSLDPELEIVKECIKVAEDTVDDGDSAYDTNMADYICSNIQHHFGVK